MSLKSAIENAKARVGAAFDAVVEKGGTKPSVANLAALPSAIESIPSGGGEDLIYPILQGDGTTNIVLRSPNVTTLNRGLSRGYSIPHEGGIELLDLPNCTKVDMYGLNESFNSYGISNIILPKCTYFYGGSVAFCSYKYTRYIELGTITNGRENPISILGAFRYSFYYVADVLHTIKLGNDWDVNLYLGNWTARNVEDDVIDVNVREYIAKTAKDNSGISAKTITFNPCLYNKLSQETLDIFESKNWDIALTAIWPS